MYRPLTKAVLEAIATELVGTDGDLQIVMSELGLDLFDYGLAEVTTWLWEDCGLTVVDDMWVLE